MKIEAIKYRLLVTLFILHYTVGQYLYVSIIKALNLPMWLGVSIIIFLGIAPIVYIGIKSMIEDAKWERKTRFETAKEIILTITIFFVIIIGGFALSTSEWLHPQTEAERIRRKQVSSYCKSKGFKHDYELAGCMQMGHIELEIKDIEALDQFE